MNYALHRSEIGEVWIQPSLLKEAPKLYLVPSPDLKSKPVKKRRERGEGSGCIMMRYYTKKGKSYEQYWYDYEPEVLNVEKSATKSSIIDSIKS